LITSRPHDMSRAQRVRAYARAAGAGRAHRRRTGPQQSRNKCLHRRRAAARATRLPRHCTSTAARLFAAARRRSWSLIRGAAAAGADPTRPGPARLDRPRRSRSWPGEAMEARQRRCGVRCSMRGGAAGGGRPSTTPRHVRRRPSTLPCTWGGGWREFGRGTCRGRIQHTRTCGGGGARRSGTGPDLPMDGDNYSIHYISCRGGVDYISTPPAVAGPATSLHLLQGRGRLHLYTSCRGGAGPATRPWSRSPSRSRSAATVTRISLRLAPAPVLPPRTSLFRPRPAPAGPPVSTHRSTSAARMRAHTRWA
jgi:hypothetical protein